MSKAPTAKVRRVYQPTRVEVAKTVLIAVLVTGITAFIGGIAFANSHNDDIVRAVEQVQAQTPENETDTVKK